MFFVVVVVVIVVIVNEYGIGISRDVWEERRGQYHLACGELRSMMVDNSRHV